MATTVALDAMGGDHGPTVVAEATRIYLDSHAEGQLILVGDERRLLKALTSVGLAQHPRIRIHHAAEQVAMDELPSTALRSKKSSSMRVAINLVKQGEAQACVSAGNTGALMAIARFVLKTLPGVERPAIIAAMPSKWGQTHVLDLGANVDSCAEHLFQFGVMGSIMVRSVTGLKSPRVGLLNIGQEEIKGNERIKEAGRLLANSELNYVGFVEGDGIFNGNADVVVCDGFVGNVALKATEGAASLIRNELKESFRRNLLTKIAGLCAMPVLNGFRKRMDPRGYNGATLLGLQGVVIKSHGGADSYAFSRAIHVAFLEASQDVPSRIRHEIETLLTEKAAG